MTLHYVTFLLCWYALYSTLFWSAFLFVCLFIVFLLLGGLSGSLLQFEFRQCSFYICLDFSIDLFVCLFVLFLHCSFNFSVPDNAQLRGLLRTDINFDTKM